MKKLIVVLICLAALFVPCAAHAEETVLCTETQTYTLDLWHYSGGYWKVGNKGSEKIRIDDAEIEALGGLGDYLESNTIASFAVELPGAVKAALADGADVRWRLKDAGVPLESIFDLDSATELSLADGRLTFGIRPRFHVWSGYTLNEYIPGLAVTIPLIDGAYGYNMYSVYGGGLNGGQCDGRFYASDPALVTAPFLHPLMIKGSDGRLTDGGSVICEGRVYASDGMRIGQGTFASAGACGLSFSFPVSVEFFVVTGDAGDPDGPQIPDDPEDPADPEDPGEAEDPEITVTALLDLPPETYEGHTVEATDCSTVNVGGESYTASQAYAKKLASASFSLQPASGVTQRRKTNVLRELTFDNAGEYDAQLTVTASGQRAGDTKAITVRRCPAVMADLGGLQKQNRRQVVTGSVAQNPKYPLQSLTVTIRDVRSGESICAEKAPCGGAEADPQNSAHIKYRTLKDAGSDAYFIRFSLEFLSKFDTDREFSLEVTARDSRGYVDRYTEDFVVVRDLPPQAAIDLAERFYRAKGGGAADIEVRDASHSDGDRLVRAWEYSTDGTTFAPLTDFEDVSFGTRQDLHFPKDSVGAFSVRLTVTDDWAEDTLPEYISAEDYLSDCAEASSVVDNAAPFVSLSLRPAVTGEVLLLAADDAACSGALAAREELRMALLREGIDAQVYAASMEGASTLSGRVSLAGVKTCDFGFQGRWPYADSFWEMYSATADERRLYKASCSWPVGEDHFDCYASPPYLITAYDRNGLGTLWTCTLSNAFRGESLDEARFGHDFEGRYLYVLAGGKTVLLDKETGAFAGTVNGSLGFNNSVTERSIYAYKSDGIYRYPRSGAAPVKIYSGECFADCDQSVQLGGRVRFLVKKGSRLYVAVFDPESEALELIYLRGTGEDQGTAVSRLLGIDSRGICVVNTESKVRVFDKDGELLATLPGGEMADAVYDASGRINYISVRSDSRYSYKGDTAYYATVSVYGIFDGYSSTQSVMSESDYPTDPARLCVAFENADGTVFIGCGAWLDYVRGLGMPYGQRFTVFTFGTKTGVNGHKDLSAFAPGLNGGIEWGYRAQGAFVLTRANNLPAGGYNETYLLNVSESRADRRERLMARYLSCESGRTSVREIAAGFDTETLASEIAAELAAGKKAAKVSGSANGAGISRTLCLEPGTTYFYEYETDLDRDVLSVTAALSHGIGASEGFTAIAEYTEDFNDGAMENFFRPGSGKVKDAAYAMVDVTRWGYLDQSDELSFTVPEGCCAALSFDYKSCSLRGNGHTTFRLTKNGGSGALWEPGGKPDNVNSSGSYTWKSLLSAGKYTLRGNLRSYSNFDNNRCTLTVDNVKVVLLKKGTVDTASSVRLPSSSRVEKSGSGNLVSGSFTSPTEVVSYGLFPTEYRSASPNAQSYAFTVPDGQKALYASWTVNSRPYEYYTSSDAYRSVSVNWELDEDRWYVCPGGAPGSSQARSYPAQGLRITKYGLSGTHTLSGNIPYQTSGSIASFAAYLSLPGRSVPAAVTAGRFFLDGNKMYAEDGVFRGNATVSLNTGKGDARISDLKIYTIEDGKRVYLCRETFADGERPDGWKVQNGTAVIAAAPAAENAPELVYKKGEYIEYDVSYSDYENDPSKESYWVYDHTPFNDGPYPLAGTILREPVHRFYEDGRYELRHWQFDDTGEPLFDKRSNIAVQVFFINGSGNRAPWIESIETDPGEPESGDRFVIEVGVGDAGGKTLTLDVELFFEGQLIESFEKKGIVPGGDGEYPPVRFSVSEPAKVGTYEIVATVHNDCGAGIDSHRFSVRSKASIEAQVDHTEQWDANRREFNLRRFGKSADGDIAFAAYQKLRSPRLRHHNVFLPEERFMLSALCGGVPVRVTAALNGIPGASVTLSATGVTDGSGRMRYSAELWNESLRSLLAKDNPKEVSFTFTAFYADGSRLTDTVKIIVDQDVGYFRLHRKW